MAIENRRNGHGYVLTEPGEAEQAYIFPDEAEEIMYRAASMGSCLAEGSVGAGKTHLLEDVGQVARREYELPTLLLSAHINGGSKSGVPNALRELDSFAESRGNDGLILLDNADYFGYSGSKGKRMYGLALAHTEVARYLTALLLEDESPLVVGVAHDNVWRKLKWRYQAKKGEVDAVTPAAQDLLDNFSSRYIFNGEVRLDVAESLLMSQGFTEKEACLWVRRLTHVSMLNYRIVARLTPQDISQHGFEGLISAINEGTRRRLGAISFEGAEEREVAPRLAVPTT